MSLIPVVEVGLWNTWVFMIPLIIIWFLGVKFLFSKRMPDGPALKRRRDRYISNLLVIAMFFSFVYSIVVPLYLGTSWFFIGLLVYVVGIVLIILTMINFASTPLDEPVTKGVYRYSRNPMFIGFFLVYTGVGVAGISWVFIVLTIAFILMVQYLSPFEEAITLGHYGKVYKEYIERTPKWIGIPKR